MREKKNSGKSAPGLGAMKTPRQRQYDAVTSHRRQHDASLRFWLPLGLNHTPLYKREKNPKMFVLRRAVWSSFLSQSEVLEVFISFNDRQVIQHVRDVVNDYEG